MKIFIRSILLSAVVACTTVATANESTHKPELLAQSSNQESNPDSKEPLPDKPSSDNAKEAENPIEEPFFDWLNVTSFNEVPIDTEEVVERSNVIAIVKIESVSQGRVLDFREGESHPMNMAVIKLNVSKVIKGDVENEIFFEYLVGGISTDTLNELAFRDEMLVFLSIADGWNPKIYKVEYGERGLTKGATLYSLTTQRGLMIVRNGEIYQPLEPDKPLFDGDSFDDIVQQLK